MQIRQKKRLKSLDARKIYNRINNASRGLKNIDDPQSLNDDILAGFYNGMSTSKVFENT